MSVDVFLLINLLALIHRNAALPVRLLRPGRAPRTSCVIRPNPAYRSSTRASQPTPTLSVCPPLSRLLHSACCTPPLSLRVLFPSKIHLNLQNLASPSLVPTGAVLKFGGSILNVHGQLSSVLTRTAPLGLMYSAVVPKGAFAIRDTPQPPKPRVSTLGSNKRRAQARWLNTNQQADASGQASILSMLNGPPLRCFSWSLC